MARTAETPHSATSCFSSCCLEAGTENLLWLAGMARSESCRADARSSFKPGETKNKFSFLIYSPLKKFPDYKAVQKDLGG